MLPRQSLVGTHNKGQHFEMLSFVVCILVNNKAHHTAANAQK